MEPLRISNPQVWLDQVFSAKSALTGGVVRRNRHWVEAEIGLDLFEQTVRDRGFHLIEAGQKLVVICHSGKVTLRF